MKAALAEHMSLSELKKLGHKLPKIWEAFKRAHCITISNTFDGVVNELNQFEELRYPDSILANGAMMELVIFREHLGTPPRSPSAVPRYPLVLEEIDELQAFIFETASINPRFFSGTMSAESKEYLVLHNRSAASW